MPPELPSPSDDLTFLSPLSEPRARRLVDFLAGDLADGVVLDVGCGWGELLLRVLAAAPAARGVGVDLDEAALANAQRSADARGLGARIELVHGDGPAALGPRTDIAAAISVGASHAFPRADPTDDRMNYAGALTALHRLVRRGGRVVFGEGIWSAPPTAAAIAPLGGREDEMVSLPELIDIAVGVGFAVVAFGEADLDEWDIFESGFSAGYAHWLAAHPNDHPEAESVRELARTQRDGYLDGYRGVLGMAYLHLLAV